MPCLWLRKEVKVLAMPGRRRRLVSWQCAGQGMQSERSPVCLPVLAGASPLWWCGTKLSLGAGGHMPLPSPLPPYCEHLRLCLIFLPLRPVSKWQDIWSLVLVNCPHEGGTLSYGDVLWSGDYCKLSLPSGGESPPIPSPEMLKVMPRPGWCLELGLGRNT